MKQLIHHMTVQKFAIKSGCGVTDFKKTGENKYSFHLPSGTVMMDDFRCRMNDAWFELFKDGQQGLAWSLDEWNDHDDFIHVTIHICPINEKQPDDVYISVEDILANAEPDDRPILKPELPKVEANLETVIKTVAPV